VKENLRLVVEEVGSFYEDFSPDFVSSVIWYQLFGLAEDIFHFLLPIGNTFYHFLFKLFEGSRFLHLRLWGSQLYVGFN